MMWHLCTPYTSKGRVEVGAKRGVAPHKDLLPSMSASNSSIVSVKEIVTNNQVLLNDYIHHACTSVLNHIRSNCHS